MTISSLDESLFVPVERDLYDAMLEVQKDIAPMMSNREYLDVLKRLADLSAPIDRFFDEVMVFCEDGDLRRNRILLLKELWGLLMSVADMERL